MKLFKIIVPVAIALVTITVLWLFFFGMGHSTSNSRTITITGPEPNPRVRELDSLSSALQHTEADMNRLKSQIRKKVSGYEFINHGLSTSVFRIVKAYSDIDNEAQGKNLLLLGYLGLKNDDTRSPHPPYKFYTENGTGYISSLSIHSQTHTTGNKEEIHRYGDFKKVGYLYSSDEHYKGILITIQSKSQVNLYKVFMWLMAVLYLVAYVFVLVNSIAVLIHISRGKAFKAINILRLKWCAFILLVMLAVPYLTTSIFYLIYFNRLSPEVSFTHSFFDSDYKTLIVGIIYWLLFLAFRKGYKLQQENDLTV